MKAYLNNREYDLEEGESILSFAKRHGVFIPSLCQFEPLKHHPGTCRVCLVQLTDEHGTRMVTSCDTQVTPGARIDTISSKVREMQRTQVELLMADHYQDCASCTRHGDCELQTLGLEVGLQQNRFTKNLLPAAMNRVLDTSANAMIRDMTKCIRCLRCVEVCRQIQDVSALTFDGKGLGSLIGVGQAPKQDVSACVQCGQCTIVCPTGALAEKDQNEQVLDYLADKDVITVFSFAPSVRVVLGDEFGLPTGTNVEGKIVAAMRKLGADVVIDTDFAADVVIMEEGTELLGRVKNGGTLPMFTSCCPAWINFAEKHIPGILPHLSTTRSPQGVLGPLAKTYLPERMGLDPKIKNISVMPCTAKKDEAARPQLSRDGVPDIDVVLTVREFSRLLKRMNIDLATLPPEPFDNPFMSASTGAAVIFGTTGGVMEAAVRTVYAILNNKELTGIVATPLRGIDGVRTAELDLGPAVGKIKVAICHGLRNARILAEEVLRGESPYTFIEVMACPGGCVDGGGTSRFRGQYHTKRAVKQQSLYTLDDQMPFRQSHNNPQIKLLYSEYLDAPNSEKAHHLLHTHYTDRCEKASQDMGNSLKQLTLI